MFGSRLVMRALLAVWGVCLLAPSIVHASGAAPHRPPAKPIAVVLFASAGSADAVPTVRRALHEVARDLPAVDLLTEAALAKRFAGGGLDAKLAACGTDLACVAAIGRSANATEVLYGRVTTPAGAAGRTVKLQALVLSCENAAVLRKVTVAAAADGLAVELRARIKDLFGVPDEVSVAPAPVVADVAPAPAAAPSFVSAPASSPVPAVAERGRASDSTAAATTPSVGVANEPASWWKRSGKLSRVALGLGVLGVGSLAAGAYFGFATASANDELSAVQHGMGGTTQLAARDDKDRADVAARRANLFLVAGAALSTVAAGLVGFDWLVIAPAQHGSLESGDRAAAVVGGTWAW